ncbi:MAG: 30S ribosomal protein S8 [Candidatus Andersenbacteria bacterium]
MPVSDPIADMLTRIRNGYLVHKDEVRLPSSQLKVALAQVLVKSGFLQAAEVAKPSEAKGAKGAALFAELVLTLKYGAAPARQPALRGVKRISKPGQRIYVSNRQIPRVNQGLGMAILSTPQGLLTDGQARKRKVGGEVVCTLW